MKPTCKKCGAEIAASVSVCPKCKTIDPFGEITDEAERFNAEQVEKGGQPSKDKPD